MPMKLYVGDIVQTRKAHPCGGNQWEIIAFAVPLAAIRCGFHG